MGWFPGAAVSASSPLKALRLEAGGSLSALPAVDGFFLFKYGVDGCMVNFDFL